MGSPASQSERETELSESCTSVADAFWNSWREQQDSPLREEAAGDPEQVRGADPDSDSGPSPRGLPACGLEGAAAAERGAFGGEAHSPHALSPPWGTDGPQPPSHRTQAGGPNQKTLDGQKKCARAWLSPPLSARLQGRESRLGGSGLGAAAFGTRRLHPRPPASLRPRRSGRGRPRLPLRGPCREGGGGQGSPVGLWEKPGSD